MLCILKNLKFEYQNIKTMIDERKLKERYKKQFLQDYLGITYPTLMTRVKDNKWNDEQINKLKELQLWITK